MTCIVGLVEKGTVYIAGDSASVTGWTSRITKLVKVFRRGPFLIGYTTSFRMGQLLEHALTVPPQGEETDDMRFMVTTFVESVRGLLKERGVAKIESNAETGGQFLVGYRKRLYSVQSDFQVNEMADGFDAVGSGCEYALGALASTKGMQPSLRLKRALEVSAHFNMAVSPPFFFKVLKPEAKSAGRRAAKAVAPRAASAKKGTAKKKVIPAVAIKVPQRKEGRPPRPASTRNRQRAAR